MWISIWRDGVILPPMIVILSSPIVNLLQLSDFKYLCHSSQVLTVYIISIAY